MVPTEWQVRTVLGDCISIRAPQHRQYTLISDSLDLVNLSMREEATLATNWIKDQPDGVELQNLALATFTGPALRSYPKNTTEDAQHAPEKMRVIGFKETIDPSRESIGNCKGFLPHLSVLRCQVLPNVQFECCMILQGTLGGNFDIFAASGESTAWVLLWKTRSRPLGVPVCPLARFNFFSTAFDPRAWTLVVFWNESLGRQLQLITPENEWRDNTNYPSPPTYTFFDDPEVPFGPQGPQPPTHVPKPREPPDSPGLPPGWPSAPPPVGGTEMLELENCVIDCIRDLHRPSLNLFHFL